MLCLFAWKWNGPKELKSSEATCLVVRNTDGTRMLFPGTCTPRSLNHINLRERLRIRNVGHEVENYLKQWQEHLARSEYDRMPRLLFDADLLEGEEK